MKNLLLFTITILTFSGQAQTWSDDVAQIMFNKCTKCHNTNGIAPMPLMTYAEASPMAAAIAAAVSTNEMPPWPVDNNYQQYVHNRSLSPTDKTTILDWVAGGALEGNSANTPPMPIYTSNAILGAGDLTVQIPTYMSKANTDDDYVCFSVPSGLTQNRTIKSIEIIPGNRQIVHHALIFSDPNNVEVTDSVGGNCAGPANNNTKLLTGYTPGATPMTLPAVSPLKLGMDIAAGSNVYFAMHYPVGSYGQYDSTKVIFHFYPLGTTGVRQVAADPIIQNWSFGLPANQVTNVTAQYPGGSSGLAADISFLSVFPHMHLLGESIKAYALNPAGDTLKLANIPQWDFHWQDFYFFKNIQKVVAGSKIKGEGTYDNTSGNPNNPNSPPQLVTAGLNTSDEMFLVYFHYMLYQTGDEIYDMEELMTSGLNEQIVASESLINVYPNPFSNDLTIDLPSVNAGDIVSVYIYNYQGQLIRKVIETETSVNSGLKVNWDGMSDNNTSVRKGVYFVSINVNGLNLNKQIIKN
ncbi:MAG: T9SS type A sorting domain-containing protein [Crocinitomicaceae bacterium]